MALALTIPRQRDPLARALLLAAASLVTWLGVTQPGTPVAAQAEVPTVVILATATPPLPTPVPTAAPPTAAPAAVLAAPTPEPQVIVQQVVVQAPPEIVYVEAPAAEPPANPYADLPVLQCPCGVNATADAPTERELQWSAKRTR